MKRRAALAVLAIPLAPSIVSAQNRAPRKIGLTMALTGPFAGASGEFVFAYQLAVQHVNEAGGINGRQVQLLVEDSKANPADGIGAIAANLSKSTGSRAILTIFTNVVTAQMTAGRSAQDLVDRRDRGNGGGRQKRNTPLPAARQDSTDAMMVQNWKQNGVKKVYIVTASNAAGQATVPRVSVRVKLCRTPSRVINLGDSDYRGPLARIKEYSPDIVYIQTSGSPSADALIVRQLREEAVNVPVYFGSNFYTTHSWRIAMGPYSEGLIFCGANVDHDSAYGRKFIRDFRAKMGFEPGYNDGYMYDGARILMHAMERANSGDAIRDAIANEKGLPSTLGGTLTMGKDHYVLPPRVALWKVRSGAEVNIIEKRGTAPRG